MEHGKARKVPELGETGCGTAGRKELQDASLAEGAAGLLAMTSTVDRPHITEVWP